MSDERIMLGFKVRANSATSDNRRGARTHAKASDSTGVAPAVPQHPSRPPPPLYLSILSIYLSM